MRVDLFTGGTRPFSARLMLGIAKLFVGVDPGPPTAFTFRLELFRREFLGYIMRSSEGVGGWGKGETELFSAFVSKTNSCNF